MKYLLVVFLITLGSMRAESQLERGRVLTINALKNGGRDERTINAVTKLYGESADFATYAKEIWAMEFTPEVTVDLLAAFVQGHRPDPPQESDLDRFLRTLGGISGPPTQYGPAPMTLPVPQVNIQSLSRKIDELQRQISQQQRTINFQQFQQSQQQHQNMYYPIYPNYNDQLMYMNQQLRQLNQAVQPLLQAPTIPRLPSINDQKR